MGKKKYAGTSIKGAEPRVRFNVQRDKSGRRIKERAMGGFITDADGEEMPIVVNRLIFQCQHPDPLADWQSVAGMGWGGPSVQIRCDVCGRSARLKQEDLQGLWLLCSTDREFRMEHHAFLGLGAHDARPGAIYAIVQLFAAERLAQVWREKLAADRAADDSAD